MIEPTAVSLDRSLFEDDAALDATESGVKALLAQLPPAEETVKDAEAEERKLQVHLQQLMAAGRTLDVAQATLQRDIHAQDAIEADGLLDTMVSTGEIPALADLAVNRRARHAPLTLLDGVTTHLRHYRVPAASIAKLCAQVRLSAARVTLAELTCRIILAKRQMLIRPLAEFESSDTSQFSVSGGISDSCIAAVIEARAAHAHLCQVLQAAEAQFHSSTQQ